MYKNYNIYTVLQTKPNQQKIKKVKKEIRYYDITDINVNIPNTITEKSVNLFIEELEKNIGKNKIIYDSIGCLINFIYNEYGQQFKNKKLKKYAIIHRYMICDNLEEKNKINIKPYKRYLEHIIKLNGGSYW